MAAHCERQWSSLCPAQLSLQEQPPRTCLPGLMVARRFHPMSVNGNLPDWSGQQRSDHHPGLGLGTLA